MQIAYRQVAAQVFFPGATIKVVGKTINETLIKTLTRKFFLATLQSWETSEIFFEPGYIAAMLHCTNEHGSNFFKINTLHIY